MSVTEWHGWGFEDSSIHIGPMPGRKSVCLYAVEGSVLSPLAYFRDTESATKALAMLDKLALAVAREEQNHE